MSEKRIAVVSILVSDRSASESINELLSRYGEYILGRMGDTLSGKEYLRPFRRP